MNILSKLLPLNIVTNGQPVSEEIFLCNKKQELSMAVMILSNQDKMRKLYKRPCIDSSCQINCLLGKQLGQMD